MPIKTGVKALVDRAMAEVETIPTADAIRLHGDPGVQFVDVRDIRELQRDGRIPGAYHAPRGMLEFWVDPESPYHKDVFDQPKKFVFFCAAGWRSALSTKTVRDMGLDNVAHVEGGFTAWKNAGGPVETPEAKS